MKKQFATLAFVSFAALGSVLSAQTTDQSTPAPAPPSTTPIHHQATPQQQVNHLTKKLALTSDQQSQILAVLTDRDQQVSGVQSDTTLSKKEQHAKLKGIRSDAQSRIRNILTDTQRTAYDQMQQEARDREKTRKLTTTQN